jgi:hypothetical protein
LIDSGARRARGPHLEHADHPAIPVAAAREVHERIELVLYPMEFP